jgi:hypothetical protein
MKKQTLFRIAISILILSFGRLPASAQADGYTQSFQIPFEFQANGKQLPAGKYLVKRSPRTPLILLIQNREQNIRMYLNIVPSGMLNQATRSTMSFKKYGESYFLSELKLQGSEFGYQMLKSKDERRLAQVAEVITIHEASRMEAPGAGN